MAEVLTPDFTFAIEDAPSHKLMEPLYAAIMGSKVKPLVSLGAVTRDAAVTWLQDQHDRYVAGVGSRSGLLKSMKLETRVDLVGLADG